MTNGHEIDDLVRGGVPPSDPGGRERARNRLRSLIDADIARLRRRRRTRRASVGVAVAMLVAIVSLQVLLPPESGGPASGAAAQFRRLGTLPGYRSVELELGPSQFLYHSIEELEGKGHTLVGGSSFEIIERTHVESWLASDGSGVRDTTYLDVTFATPEDRTVWESQGEPDIPTAGDLVKEHYPPGGLDFLDVSQLPSDPEELRQELESGSISGMVPGNTSLLSKIATVLSQETLPQDVREAMFTVASEIPGIVLTPDSADPLGRPAVAVSLADTSGATTLYFDPVDASFLGIGETLPAVHGGGSISTWIAFTASSVVDRIGEQPAS